MTLSTTNACRSLRAGTAYRRCRCWRIIRKDGVAIYITDHNRTVTFEGFDFLAPKGGESSDRRREASLKPGDQEWRLIISDLITVEDLAAGLYDNARVDEWVLDWKYPFLGAFTETVYFISSQRFNGETLQASATTAAELYRNRLGQTMDPFCDWSLGGAGCNLDLATYRPFGGGAGGTQLSSILTSLSITGLVNPVTFEVAGIPNDYADRTYTDGTTDRYFQFGRVRWVSGPNTGTEGNIVDYQHANRRIVLATNPGRPLQIANQLDVIAGCDRRGTTCIEKWNNFGQFRGFELIPQGSDVLDPP